MRVDAKTQSLSFRRKIHPCSLICSLAAAILRQLAPEPVSCHAQCSQVPRGSEVDGNWVGEKQGGFPVAGFRSGGRRLGLGSWVLGFPLTDFRWGPPTLPHSGGRRLGLPLAPRPWHRLPHEGGQEVLGGVCRGAGLPSAW
jgi:hypothetical protein